MVRVGDHVDVVTEGVEHRKAVRRESTDTARRGMAHQAGLALEPLLAVGQRCGPDSPEVLAHDEVWTGRAVGVDGDLAPRLLDPVGHVATLHAAEVEVRLVVDAPLALDQHVAVLVAQRGISVHVNYRRHVAVVVHQVTGVDTQRALLEGPELPRRLSERPVAHHDVGGVGEVQHLPQLGDPRAGGRHDMVDGDRRRLGSLAGNHVGDGTAVDHQLGDQSSGNHAYALGLHLGQQAVDGGHVVGVATLLLM